MTRVLLRCTTATFCLMTAGYALLCASPFTFHNFVRADLFGASTFALWHARLYWLWLAIAIVDIRSSVPEPVRYWRIFAAVWALPGAYLAIRPILPVLADDRRSIVVGIVSFVPLIWIAVVEYWTRRRWLADQRPIASGDVDRAEGRLLFAAAATALFVAIGSALLVPILMRGQFEPDLLTAGLALGLTWTLSDAAVIFFGAFLTVATTARLVRRASLTSQYLALLLVAGVGAAVCFDRAVAQTLGFAGSSRVAIDVAAAAAIAATWGAQQVRKLADSGVAVSSPIDLLLGAAPQPRPVRVLLLPLGVVLAATWAASTATRNVDWDFVMVNAATASLWAAAFVHLYRGAPARAIRSATLAAICLAPLTVWLGATSAEHARPSIRRTLNRYLVYNASLRVGDSVLQRATATATPLQRFLREHTSVAGPDLRPIDLDFVAPLPRLVRPPHVFLFVIDSLRPDYLSPYNRSVTFTPRIAQFASESVVFSNAMTRYGATGLSLPAIWSGAVGLHYQYLKPFAPMNTLEKFLTVNGYRRVLNTDVLMARLIEPSAGTIELGPGRGLGDHDLCATLQELESRFPATGDGDPPVFAYSNPQNLHLADLVTASVPEGERYDGFHAPYASRVRAVDACFGTFVDFLKRRGLYDRSVIVLTSDHGELLGEEGRWGHAYYLFPQVLQVPLIVHLPASAPVDDALDRGALSWSIDIVPTIYAAAGYSARPANALMGAPLIGPTRIDTAARRRGDYVVEASYSAVYGVVRKNGRRVYIIDAVSGSEYGYTRRTDGGWDAVPVVDAIRAPAQRILREHVDEARRVYRLPALK